MNLFFRVPTMVENEFKEKVNALSDRGGESNSFDYDSYDWGCLRYLLELWIFLNRLRKQEIRGTRNFFNAARPWLSDTEKLRNLSSSFATLFRVIFENRNCRQIKTSR